MSGRVLFYLAYILIVFLSFALADLFPTPTMQALPPNFLSGFVIVAFVDSLLRMSENRRRKPMDIIVRRNNSVARARLKNLFASGLVAAEETGAASPGQYDLAAGLDVPLSFADMISQVPLNYHMRDGTLFIARLAQEITSTRETLEQSLGQYGMYQDPETAALLGDIMHSTLFIFVDQLHRSGIPPAYTLPPDFWKPLIKWHNQLAGRLNRDASRLGVPPSDA